ncbi:MAG: adenylate/guanylate cyclase [Saprospiraceae bacterium]|nr:adenylate/guanylate cyclase [Saprospiraceae bacterium]
MTQFSLKSIIGKRSDLRDWLQSWCDISDTEIAVEDIRKGYVFGTPIAADHHTVSIEIENETLGFIHGQDKNAAIIAGLLTIILKKDAERKNLGAEVLNLYQELNVIYNFSERLSETIDPDAISRVALEQAMHSITSDSGVVLLWDAGLKQLLIPAKSGESLFNEVELAAKSELLFKIGLSGQSEILSDLSVLKEKGMINHEIESMVYAAMKVKQRTLGAIILADRVKDNYSAAHLKLLVTLALQSSSAIESALLYEKNIREVQEREEAMLKIHEVTKKFVPSEFILSLGKETLTDVKLGDQVKKIVTVLFTDIRDFTSLSEMMTPEENFRFVSAFNERLGPVIRSNHGFINQYLGDSIMAIFPRNPDDALQAALGMQKAITKLNVERKELDLPAVRAGIGMHTGPLIMGITGDENRLDAATISDTVNTAARIESLTKYYHADILLSEDTLLYIPGSSKFQFRNLGKVLLKGKNNSLVLVECLNSDVYGLQSVRAGLITQFDDAVRLFQDSKFDKAIHLLQTILEQDPEDQCAKVFIEKAELYLLNGPPANWTGAEKMLSK